MTYQFKPGSRFAVKAQVVGERLEALQAVVGHITPATVVEDAQPEDSPLHPLFEWDDSVAGVKYREDQARHVIRCVYPIHIGEDGTEKPVLGYIHVNLPEGGPCYVTTARAVSDEELTRQMEADAIGAFEALRRRYAHITTLRGVFREIDRIGGRPARRKQGRAQARA